MTLLDQAVRDTDDADLVILALVESLRGRGRIAEPTEVARQIAGAPRPQVVRRLERLAHIGLLEQLPGRGYAVSLMGAELLLREVGGWEPSPREMTRRDSLALSAAAGAIAPRRL